MQFGFARVVTNAGRTVQINTREWEYSTQALFLTIAFVSTHVDVTCTENVGVKIN